MSHSLIIELTDSPRPEDPKNKQVIWIGAVFKTTPPDHSESLEQIGDAHWVSYEQVIAYLEQRGDSHYADFFRKASLTPGGRYSPGIVIPASVCKVIDPRTMFDGQQFYQLDRFEREMIVAQLHLVPKDSLDSSLGVSNEKPLVCLYEEDGIHRLAYITEWPEVIRMCNSQVLARYRWFFPADSNV